MKTPIIRRAAVATLAAAAIGGVLFGTSASAQPSDTASSQAHNGSLAAAASPGTLRDTDRPLINGRQADFGTGGLNVSLSRQPNNAGTLTWHQTQATASTNLVQAKPSVFTARLTGRVYWDDALAGGCARVRVILYNTNGTVADSKVSGSACQIGPNFTPPSKPVDLTVKSINAHKVVITTQIGPDAAAPSSAYRNTAHQTWYFGQVPQD